MRDTDGSKTRPAISFNLSHALRFQHFIVSHAARRQVALAAEGEGGFGAGVLLGVVVFPFDADGAVVADAIQLDEDLLDAIGVARGAGRDEVPAVERMSHGAMAAKETGPRVFAAHLHAFDVGAVNEFPEL